MKRMIVMLAIAGASVAGWAQPPPPHPASNPGKSFTTTSPPPAWTPKKMQTRSKVTTLFTLSKPVVKARVTHVDGMSSRPWADIVGPYPGWSAFPSPEREDPLMPLVSMNLGPVQKSSWTFLGMKIGR